MKTSILLNAALTISTAYAGVVPQAKSAVTSTNSMVRRDRCAHDTYKVYENHDSFLCVGKVVFWTGVSLATIYAPTINAAATQFASWVKSKVTGEESAAEKRDSTVAFLEEDDETITYRWAPSLLDARDGTDISFIHDMTKRVDKETGQVLQADIVFESEHEDDGVAIDKRSTKIYITYWAEKGHSNTELNENDVANLYSQIFYRADPNAGSECGYAANSGTWHGAFKVTVEGAPSAGECEEERKF